MLMERFFKGGEKKIFFEKDYFCRLLKIDVFYKLKRYTYCQLLLYKFLIMNLLQIILAMPLVVS